MNEKEKALIEYLKTFLIPHLKKTYEENEKIKEERDKENKRDEIAWFHAGWNLGIKNHLEDCEKIIRLFEGDKEKGNKMK